MRALNRWSIIFALGLSIFVLAQSYPPGYPSPPSGGGAVESYWTDAGAGFIYTDEALRMPDGGPLVVAVTGNDVRAAMVVANTTNNSPTSEGFICLTAGGITTANCQGAIFGTSANSGGQLAGLNLNAPSNGITFSTGGPGTSATSRVSISSIGVLAVRNNNTIYETLDSTGFSINGVLTHPFAAPTVSSGFGTGPAIVGYTATSFRVTIGSGGTADTGVLTLPATYTGWNCSCWDVTTVSSTVFACRQVAGTTTSATLKNFDAAGSAAAWVAGDSLAVVCTGY